MKTSTLPLRILCALATTTLVAVAAAETRGADLSFAQAADQHQKSRYSGAYGRFVILANRGDRDAARIALFMHRYGPSLYGTFWDASMEEVETWEQLASQGGRVSPRFRTPPEFRPKH